MEDERSELILGFETYAIAPAAKQALMNSKS
jgi:hypothetical protein